ncbi:MAG: hypothetical protein GX660_11080 [Clostridiaceae bacterium]|nr:hypothetical protein [Clostridiaceae bacterium]
MKKLIIVCEGKHRQCGDYLSQLVSLDDDKDIKVVGVKDGAVASQVWTEEEYSANSAQISSEQYILFIGNSKLIKDKRSHMLNKYSEYGMQYGWLGKQAVLFVERVVDMKEYDSFIDYARRNQSDVTKLIELKSDVMDIPDDINEEDAKGIKKVLNPIKTLQAVIVNAPIRGLNAFNKMSNNKKIEGQQYTCLVLVFYLNGLSQFLGLSEG